MPAAAEDGNRPTFAVRVDAVEYRTPSPARWRFHKSGLDLEHMPVQVKLGCGNDLEFENAQHVTDWFGDVDHRYDGQLDGYVVDCRKCALCEVGVRLRTAAAAESPEVQVTRTDGRLFFAYTPGPIKCKRSGK
jgi:hypothetical protein